MRLLSYHTAVQACGVNEDEWNISHTEELHRLWFTEIPVATSFSLVLKVTVFTCQSRHRSIWEAALPAALSPSVVNFKLPFWVPQRSSYCMSGINLRIAWLFCEGGYLIFCLRGLLTLQTETLQLFRLLACVCHNHPFTKPTNKRNDSSSLRPHPIQREVNDGGGRLHPPPPPPTPPAGAPPTNSIQAQKKLIKKSAPLFVTLYYLDPLEWNTAALYSSRSATWANELSGAAQHGRGNRSGRGAPCKLRAISRDGSARTEPDTRR